MDIDKLTPLPLEVATCRGDGHTRSDLCYAVRHPDGRRAARNPDDVEFYILARNYADVQARRGWTVECNSAGWEIIEPQVPSQFVGPFEHPLEAWQSAVEADRWLTEREKGG